MPIKDLPASRVSAAKDFSGAVCGGDRRELGPGVLFFFNDTGTPEIYPLSLHDALPINDTATTEIYPLSLHDVFRSRWSPYHSPISTTRPCCPKPSPRPPPPPPPPH